MSLFLIFMTDHLIPICVYFRIEILLIVCFVQVHVAASECLEEVIKLYREFNGAGGVEVEVAFKTELGHQWEIEKNEQAKSLMKNCIDIIDSLQHKSV